MDDELESALQAHLDVLTPDGRHFATLDLSAGRCTVGRLAPGSPALPDLALPDPELFVSRLHCVLEHEQGAWSLVDNDSRNGTYLRRDASLERVNRRRSLADGDTICLVGRLSETGDPVYWELRFSDPAATRAAPVPRIARGTCLSYNAAEARLVIRDGSTVHEVHLSPHEHRLVRYMAERNEEHAESPVLCLHEDLMRAVWGEEPLHSQGELNRLVWGLRRKLEDFTHEPLLENERGLGYRLCTCP